MAWELGVWIGRLPEVSEATNLRKWMDWCIRWKTTQRPAASSSRLSLLPGTTLVLRRLQRPLPGRACPRELPQCWTAKGDFEAMLRMGGAGDTSGVLRMNWRGFIA
jgi:hypothetical protein